MFWLWLILGLILLFFGLLILALMAPVRIQVEYPNFTLEVRWLGIAFDLYYLAGDLRMKLCVWGFTYRFTPPDEATLAKQQAKAAEKKAKAEAKKAKAAAKKPAAKEPHPKKWRWQNFTPQLWKEIMAHPALPSIQQNSKRLFLQLWRSAVIEKALIRFDVGDYYWNGILHGFVFWLPRSEKIRIEPNFLGEMQFQFLLKVSLWRILKALILFLVFFPYKKTNHLYSHVRYTLRTE